MDTEKIDFDNPKLLWVVFANELANEIKTNELATKIKTTES